MSCRDLALTNELRRCRIFVVDDEHVIAATLGMILERHGYEAAAFGDPREALKAAASSWPDLVISDVVMPHMNGFDLARRLKLAYPTCKVLLFSGQAATADEIEHARTAMGYMEVLRKPMHPNALLKHVQALMHE